MGASLRVDESDAIVQALGRQRGEKDTPSLRKVVARTLGLRLDKEQQCSEWARRPLEPAQFLVMFQMLSYTLY